MPHRVPLLGIVLFIGYLCVAFSVWDFLFSLVVLVGLSLPMCQLCLAFCALLRAFACIFLLFPFLWGFLVLLLCVRGCSLPSSSGVWLCFWMLLVYSLPVRSSPSHILSWVRSVSPKKGISCMASLGPLGLLLLCFFPSWPSYINVCFSPVWSTLSLLFYTVSTLLLHYILFSALVGFAALQLVWCFHCLSLLRHVLFVFFGITGVLP